MMMNIMRVSQNEFLSKNLLCELATLFQQKKVPMVITMTMKTMTMKRRKMKKMLRMKTTVQPICIPMVKMKIAF